jgi:predicted membrane chloride channel (bestrophin family)
MDKHSKWPIFMRMHGSVMPKMILPLLFVAAWSSFITLISKFVHPRKDFSDVQFDDQSF